jgi:hypothetical protein
LSITPWNAASTPVVEVADVPEEFDEDELLVELLHAAAVSAASTTTGTTRLVSLNERDGMGC